MSLDTPGRVPPGARSLPARHYTDPETFREELEQFFGRLWFCAGRAEQIPRRGDFLVRQVLGESLIILRDGAGAVRSYYNVCRHRGTRLCDAPEGTFAGPIQCPYHAWTYDLDGRLVAAPQMDCGAGFRLDEFPLAPVAADDWDGHLFLSLAREPAPLRAQLGSLPEMFRPWGMAALRRGERIVYDVAANWKLILQNYSECLHCPVIHPELQRLSHFLSGVNQPAEDGFLGGWMRLRDDVATLSRDGTTPRAGLPGLSPDERRRVYYYAVLPNLLLSLHPDYMMTHLLWPRACDRTEVVCEWHFHPDELGRPGFDPGDAVAFWDTVNRQDWHVCELSQQGLTSRSYTPGPYSEREQLLYEFDRLILRAEAERRGSRPS
jgi:Rieske 2Fe-2S family protein